MENRDNIQFDGNCAFAVSTGKMEVKGTAYSSTLDGKVYFFSNPIAKFLFRILPNRVEKANANWKNRNK
jgi:YHS domain-containing protein